MMREMDFVDECYADKDLSLLKKLTLVIPTYNRNYYLSRCLWYHAHFPFGEIIVADSSPEEKKVVNRETVQRIREMFGANIRYLEYEPETEKYGGDIYRKWGDAVQHVETEYSQICTDKDFQIPTTHTKCIEHLEMYTDYTLAEGDNYLIKNNNKNNKKEYYLWQSRGSIIATEPLTRLYMVIPYNACPLLAIYRSGLQKEIYSRYISSSTPDLRFGEATIELLSIISGKYLRLSGNESTCRDIINLQVGNKINKEESSTIRYPKIWEYTKEEYNQRYYDMRSCLRDYIFEHSSEQLTIINDYLEAYLPQYLSHRFDPSSPIIKKSIMLRHIWNNVPRSLKRLIGMDYGYNVPKRLPKSKITTEMKMIEEAIENNKYRNLDLVYY